MKVVLVMFKDGERRDFSLTVPKTVVGRRQDCDLRIPTGDVSRQHCEISVEDEELLVKDLGSSNGTYVNGRRIEESALKPGDKLGVGPVVFVVQIDGKPASIKPEDTKLAASAAAAGAVDEDELFELDEADFDVEDPISALGLDDEDEDDDRTKTHNKK